MWLFALLALAGVTLLVILLVRLIGGGLVRGNEPRNDVSGAGRADRSRAHQILGERLAKGELSVEEYRQRLQTLRENE
jgi:putative membrane protein